MCKVKLFQTCLFAFLLYAAICTTVNAAAIPQIINYSGRLTGQGGTSVPNGNYTIEFKLYNVDAGGSALWAEKWDATTRQVTTIGGAFNVMLGAHNPIPATFFTDNPVTYLGIKVGTDTEMQPRQKISSVGYAFAAGNGIPKGGIIMWSGPVDAIPDGWVLCDKTNTVAYGTPDLTDRFIVGAGKGTGLIADGSYKVGDKSQSIGYTVNLKHRHMVDNHSHGGATGTEGKHQHTGTTGQAIDADLKRKGTDTSQIQELTRGVHTHAFTTNPEEGEHAHYIPPESPGTDEQLSTTQDIRPPYYALAFIMKL